MKKTSFILVGLMLAAALGMVSIIKGGEVITVPIKLVAGENDGVPSGNVAGASTGYVRRMNGRLLEIYYAGTFGMPTSTGVINVGQGYTSYHPATDVTLRDALTGRHILTWSNITAGTGKMPRHNVHGNAGTLRASLVDSVGVSSLLIQLTAGTGSQAGSGLTYDERGLFYVVYEK